MKKTYINIIFIAFSLIVNSQNLNIEVEYSKAMKRYNDKSISSPKILKGLSYILKANSMKSIFVYNKKMDEINKRFIGRGGGKGIYFTDLLSKNKLLQRETRDGTLFRIISDLKKYNWVIRKETKMIGNYKCYKANAVYEEYSPMRKMILKFKIVAWFTPEIPLPFGPSGYDGLPGLVLEVRNGSFYFIASKVSFKKEIGKIKEPTKGKKVTLKEYNEILYKNMENTFGKGFYEKYRKRKKEKN